MHTIAMGLRCSFWYSIAGRGCLGNRNCQLSRIQGLAWWDNWFFLLPVLYLLTAISLATFPHVDFLFVLYFRVLFRKMTKWKWYSYLCASCVPTMLSIVMRICLPGQRISRSEYSWCTVRKGEFSLDVPSPTRNVSSNVIVKTHKCFLSHRYGV